MFPVLTYARSDDLAAGSAPSSTIGLPQNMAVLDRMIARRDELARLLASAHGPTTRSPTRWWAPPRMSAFIDRVADGVEGGPNRDYQTLLGGSGRTSPARPRSTGGRPSYLQRAGAAAEYDFDSQQVRPYFPYDRVKQGVLDISGTALRRDLPPDEGRPGLASVVEGWEMLEDGKVVGRFYLDMHPRPGKYGHAAHFRVRTGTTEAPCPSRRWSATSRAAPRAIPA